MSEHGKGLALLELAHQALQRYLEAGEVLEVPPEVASAFGPSHALFVTLTNQQGKVGGCRGSFVPTRGTLAEEVVEMTLLAAGQDRRYPPVKREELPDIKLSIAFVGPLEPIAEVWSVNPRTDGLLVTKGGESGVILPGEAKTVAWMVKEACRQAGIVCDEGARFFRFQAFFVQDGPDTERRGR